MGLYRKMKQSSPKLDIESQKEIIIFYKEVFSLLVYLKNNFPDVSIHTYISDFQFRRTSLEMICNIPSNSISIDEAIDFLKKLKNDLDYIRKNTKDLDIMKETVKIYDEVETFLVLISLTE